MSLFASEVSKPPKSGFRWIDGLTVEWDEEDVEEWDSDGEGAWPVSWIQPPELCPAGRVLTLTVRGEKLRGRSESEFYDPLAEHTGLFRNFASLETEQSILRFANNYGWLGRDFDYVIPSDKASEIDEESLMQGKRSYECSVSGQSLSRWESKIKRIRSPISLWDMLRSEDTDSLAKTIRSEGGVLWYEYNELTHNYRYADPVAISVERSAASSEKLTSEEIRGLGWMGLKKEINENINTVNTQIDLGLDAELSMVVAVEDLSAAIWLQFALAVAGNKKYEHCIHCQDYFEIGPSAARKGKQYCSNACRMAAYRLRRRKRS